MNFRLKWLNSINIIKNINNKIKNNDNNKWDPIIKKKVKDKIRQLYIKTEYFEKYNQC